MGSGDPNSVYVHSTVYLHIVFLKRLTIDPKDLSFL